MSVLFEETNIKSMKLKNRLVRSATHEALADDDGFPTESLYRLYNRLARGGVGLIITGHSYVSQDGKVRAKMGIDSDAHIPRYRELISQVHKNGSKIVMQINHAGRQTFPAILGVQPMAPSVVKDTALKVKPREMTEADIERVIDAYGRAAGRVRESGFDGVQIQGTHGYLVNQFLNPHTNRRRDRWGGSTLNRMQFVTEVYRRVRETVGEDYPVLIKISAYDHLKRGLKREEGLLMAKELAAMGFDGIEISCGLVEDGGSTIRGDIAYDVIADEWPMYRNKNALFRYSLRNFGRFFQKPIPFTPGFNRDIAGSIKRNIQIPVFVVGGMIDPAFMEDTIRSGDGDYISLSRALIADPKFPEKIAEGHREISRCVHCNLCWFYLETRPIRCYRRKRSSTENHTI